MIHAVRVAQVAADVQAVDEEHAELGDARLAQTLEGHFGDLFVALEQDFARFLVDVQNKGFFIAFRASMLFARLI